LKQDLRSVLPEHTNIYIMYGATEASARLSCLDPARFDEKIDSIGTPIANVTMKVLDETGRELPAGKTGELVALGENIMQGYWKDPLLTAKVLDKNGYHTGDLGWKDEEGFFYLAGRRDNLLKVGGHRINPLEIEDCIMGSGFAVEVAVLGVVDKMLGNRLIGLVVAKGLEVTDENIFKFCAGALPPHKIPSEIRMVPKLPKKENGKIDRGACQKIIEGNRN
jgi:long-chain acyl-CoA synthetase